MVGSIDGLLEVVGDNVGLDVVGSRVCDGKCDVVRLLEVVGDGEVVGLDLVGDKVDGLADIVGLDVGLDVVGLGVYEEKLDVVTMIR